MLTRRQALQTMASIGAVASQRWLLAAEAQEYQLNYLVGSCMYGYASIEEILPEVRKTGATAIDIWPKVHGNQREQLAAMGEERFAELLAQHQVSLGCITQYPLGPFGQAEELQLAKRFNCHTLVTGAKGPKGLKGPELKQAIVTFIEQLKPHLVAAEEADVVLALENHGNSLLESPDSIRWLVELRPSPNLGIALAPYHLPQDPGLLAQIIRDIGPALAVFYAWQHGHGCMTKLPKDEELLQLPGRGDLDFSPLLASLRDINYKGWTEIFMHPVPRGIPIHETTSAVTAEIQRSREYLDNLLAATPQ